MSNRTGAEHEARRKLFLRMTFASSLLDTNACAVHDNPADCAIAKPQRGG